MIEVDLCGALCIIVSIEANFISSLVSERGEKKFSQGYLDSIKLIGGVFTIELAGSHADAIRTIC